MIKSWKKLTGMMEEFENSKEYEKKALEIDMYYNMIHTELSDSKTYPLDVKVLLEFSLSFILPVAIVFLQIYLS